MSIRRFGTHHQGPLLGSDRAAKGALDDLPIELLARVESSYYFNDFKDVGDFVGAGVEWTVSTIVAGTAAVVAGTSNGILRLDSPAQNQGPIVQPTAATTALIHDIAVGSATNEARVSTFGARFSLTDADASDSFVGLAEIHAVSGVLDAAGVLTSDNHAGFHTTNADNGTFRFSAAGTSDLTAQTVEGVFTLTDNEPVDVMVRVVGNRFATGYWRTGNHTSPWRSTATIDLGATNVWDGAIFPSFAQIGDAAGDDLDIDYVFLANLRDRRL